jgi:hypothetical protein
MPNLADLFMTEIPPDQANRYVGAEFDPVTGEPSVAPDARDDFLAGTPGTVEYSPRPGVPNALDMQSDGVPAVSGFFRDAGSPIGPPALGADPNLNYSPVPQYTGEWYDQVRPNAGYPLPVPVEYGIASQFKPANDQAALAANVSFPIDDYVRFTQPDLNPTDSRITERTFDTPVPWKANPTFGAQIQEPRPWDRVLGAWPWNGNKAAISQPVTSLPLFYPQPLADGIPSPSGAANATVPNTPSLSPSPMTFRIIPEQWDSDYVYSGV